MYKKITSYFVLILFTPLVALGDGPSRARLYTSTSTSASHTACTTCEVKATGYSAGYVRGDGFGIGLASSKATVTGLSSDIYYDSGLMIDLTKTWGSNFTFTFGYGLSFSKPTTNQKLSENWELKG